MNSVMRLVVCIAMLHVIPISCMYRNDGLNFISRLNEKERLDRRQERILKEVARSMQALHRSSLHAIRTEIRNAIAKNTSQNLIPIIAQGIWSCTNEEARKLAYFIIAFPWHDYPQYLPVLGHALSVADYPEKTLHEVLNRCIIEGKILVFPSLNTVRAILTKIISSK